MSSVPSTITVLFPVTLAITLKQILEELPNGSRSKPISTELPPPLLLALAVKDDDEFLHSGVTSLYTTVQTFSLFTFWLVNVHLMPKSLPEIVREMLTKLLIASAKK